MRRTERRGAGWRAAALLGATALGCGAGTPGGDERPDAPADLTAIEPDETANWCANLNAYFQRTDNVLPPWSVAGPCRVGSYCKGASGPHGCNATSLFGWACQCGQDGLTACVGPPRCDAGPDYVPPDEPTEDVPQDGADGASGDGDGAASGDVDAGGEGLMDAGAG